MAPLSIRDSKRKDLFRSSGYINAQWVNAEFGETFMVYDPATLEALTTILEMGKAETEKVVTAAQ